MFTMIITSEVRKELNKINFKFNGDVNLLKIIDDICVLRVFDKEISYIVRYYKGNSKVNEFVYEDLEKYGIKSINYYVVNSNLIIHEDVDDNEDYIRASKDDLKDVRVIAGLAKWYKKLHSFRDSNILDYAKYFTLENLKKVMRKFNLSNNETLLYIGNNFDNINLKARRVNKCLTYGDFSLDNLVISKDYKDVFLFNFDNIRMGNRCSDINSVLNCLDDKSKELFMSEYGTVSNEEFVVDYVVSSVVELFLATKETFFPEWIKSTLEGIHNGELLKQSKCLVEWY